MYCIAALSDGQDSGAAHDLFSGTDDSLIDNFFLNKKSDDEENFRSLFDPLVPRLCFDFWRPAKSVRVFRRKSG